VLPAGESIAIGREAGELKHLSSRTRERNLDSPSSGERTGTSPNRDSVRPQPLLSRGFGGDYSACGADKK
jgi:hypothetical protein